MDEGCWRWSCQKWGKDHREDSWMQWRTSRGLVSHTWWGETAADEPLCWPLKGAVKRRKREEHQESGQRDIFLVCLIQVHKNTHTHSHIHTQKSFVFQSRHLSRLLLRPLKPTTKSWMSFLPERWMRGDQGHIHKTWYKPDTAGETVCVCRYFQSSFSLIIT